MSEDFFSSKLDFVSGVVGFTSDIVSRHAIPRTRSGGEDPLIKFVNNVNK